MNCTKVQTRLGIAYGSLEAGDREQQIPQGTDFGAPNRPSSTTKHVVSNAGLPRGESEAQAQTVIALCRNLRDVLWELHALLEEYSPSWYTQRHYEHAEIALQRVNGL